MRSRITFPGGERAAFFLALAGALYFALSALAPVLVLFLIACAVATLSYPVYRWMMRHSKHPRLTSAALVTMLLVFVLAPLSALTTYLVHRLIDQLSKLADYVGNPTAVTELTRKLGPLGPYAKRELNRLGPALGDAAPALAHRTAELLAVVGRNLAEAALGLFLMAVTVYYLYLDGVAWRERVIRLLPLDPNDVRAFFRQFHRVSVGVLVGSVGTAAAQGVAAVVGFWIFGIPVPLVFGALTFGAALLPGVGTALIVLLLTIWLFLNGHPVRGAGFFAYGVVVIGTVDNVLRPILTKTGLRIHPLLAFLAVFGGLASYGLAGLFLGPLAVATAVALIEIYERRISREPPKGALPA